ncbi:MAG: hypothetical protein OSB51_09970 [Dokdonia donghaensis]|nr:hypothetical protein [Dokdonia donghaensis]
MKNKLLAFTIIALGILLSLIKYNGFNIWEVDSLPLDLFSVLGSVCCVIAITIYNLSLTGEGESVEFSFNRLSLDLKPNSSSLNERKRYFISMGILALFSALYLGFKNKTLTNTYILGKAAKKKSEWQKDAYLQAQLADDGFFELTHHSFNYEIFFIILILVAVVSIVIWKTIYYEKIKHFIKSIQRA